MCPPIQLQSRDGSEYLIQHDSEAIISTWHKAIAQGIQELVGTAWGLQGWWGVGVGIMQGSCALRSHTGSFMAPVSECPSLQMQSPLTARMAGGLLEKGPSLSL